MNAAKTSMAKGLMTEGPIWKQLLFFSLPLLLGNVFQQMYNTVDSIVVGNYIGSEALAAVGASSPLTFLLIGFFMGVSTGASIIISQKFGARQHDELQDAVHTALALTLVTGVAVTIVGVLLSPVILRLMGTPEDVIDSAVIYLRIYFWGSIPLMVYNMGSGILRAVGDSKRPLYFLIVSSVLNVILDIVFVVAFNMGIAGVAWATMISQLVSSVLVILTLTKTTEIYKVYFSKIRFYPGMTGKIVRLGLPAGLQSSIISLSNLMVQGYINGFGSAAMAGIGACHKIDAFINMPINSFALAITTFTGQNIGAKKYDRVNNGFRTYLMLSIATVILIGVPVFIFADKLIMIFSQDASVIFYGAQMLRYLVPFYVFICVNQGGAAHLRGAGVTLPPMIILVINYCVFRQIFLAASMAILPSIVNVYLSYSVTWVTAAASVWLYYKKSKWMDFAMQKGI